MCSTDLTAHQLHPKAPLSNREKEKKKIEKAMQKQMHCEIHHPLRTAPMDRLQAQKRREANFGTRVCLQRSYPKEATIFGGGGSKLSGGVLKMENIFLCDAKTVETTTTLLVIIKECG
jgi:hypothetical protein